MAKKLAVLYWSGTGNTEKMALAVAKRGGELGLEVVVKTAGEATAADVSAADMVALGCPSMGAEVLEETEMQPLVDSLTAEVLGDRPVGLFGSYGWGDGEWMRNWVASMSDLGAKVVGDGVMAHEDPDDEALTRCASLVDAMNG